MIDQLLRLRYKHMEYRDRFEHKDNTSYEVALNNISIIDEMLIAQYHLEQAYEELEFAILYPEDMAQHLSKVSHHLHSMPY